MTKSGDVQLYDKKRNSPDVKKRLPVKCEVSAEECFLRLLVYTIFSRSGTEGSPRGGTRKAQGETFSQLVSLRLEK